MVAVVGLVALAAYGLLLWRHVGAVAAGSDSSGYMNGARLIASGKSQLLPRALPGLPASGDDTWLYSPLGFKPAPHAEGIVPTYPTGLSLLVLLFVPLFGWQEAGNVMIVAHALAGVAATYALGRLLGLGRIWSLLGAAVIALSPLTLFMSLQAMSDMPSLTWTALAVIAALKSRERDTWALAAGAAVSVAVLLRPTNAFALLPVVAALGFAPRRLAYLVLGGVPGASFFLLHNHHAYGTLLTTGYGDFSFAFGSAYILPTLEHYRIWIPRLFTPGVAAVLAVPFVRTVPPRIRWLLGLWILGTLGFYSTYSCTHETWWYLRFLLPAAPALVLGALLVLQCLISQLPVPETGIWPFRGLALALGLAVPYLSARSGDLEVLHTGISEARYGRAADWIRGHVPQGSTCLCMQASGALLYYTDVTLVRWDRVTEKNAARIEAALERSGKPVYAVLFPFELTSSGMPRVPLPGKWTQITKSDDITVFLRDTPGPSPLP